MAVPMVSKGVEQREGRIMRVLRTIVGVVVVAGMLLAPTLPPAHSQAAEPNPAKVAALKMALRDLYINHIFWVRSLVIATRLGEKGAVSEADEYGEKNAKAIGQSIAPFYGQAAGDKFATLFVGHYSAVKAYMRAAFANNFRGSAASKKAAVAQLTQNASAIAAFVSSANPNLPKGTVYGLLLTHGQQHIMSIDATAKKDWSAEADMWDPMVKHVYTISDALADGIAKQFPGKF
ncbi:MAG TPA: hypothetical protein VFJ24_04375 [Gaiellales bacterium]|nr:hypothetical protein [Gaiellales bacterium]